MKNLEYDKYTLRLVSTAEGDLREIHNYISQILQEPQIANRLIKKIKREMNILKRSPYACIEVHTKRQKESYRRLVIGNYIVLYKIREIKKEVLIFHIFYGKRDYLVIDN